MSDERIKLTSPWRDHGARTVLRVVLDPAGEEKAVTASTAHALLQSGLAEGLATVELTEDWSGHEKGTVFKVLQPGEEISEEPCLDPVRAACLVEIGTAKEPEQPKPKKKTAKKKAGRKGDGS